MASIGDWTLDQSYESECQSFHSKMANEFSDENDQNLAEENNDLNGLNGHDEDEEDESQFDDPEGFTDTISDQGEIENYF